MLANMVINHLLFVIGAATIIAVTEMIYETLYHETVFDVIFKNCI